MKRQLDLMSVSVRYGGVTAVDGVSLALPSGRVSGVVGPNGAGKSSLLAAASGFVRPSAGTVSVGDTELPPGQPHVLAKLGVRRSFQNSRPLTSLSVVDNVALGAHNISGTSLFDDFLRTRRARSAEESRRSRSLEALETVGLQSLANSPVGVLSYGQLRLMEIARVLVSDPWLVLLDEPAAGLNAAEADKLGVLLRKLVDEHDLGVVLVEHNLGLVMAVCDDLHVLDMGRLIASGVPREVALEPNVVAAYTGLG